MQYLVTNQINFTDDVIDYVSISPVQALEILEKEFIWGLDTETTGMDAHSKFIKSIQIGNELDQYYLDDTVNYQYFQSFFENPNRTFVLQNAKFDLKFFYNINIVLPKVFDTYLAERLLWLGYPPGYHPMSLDHLVYSYLGHNDVDKTVRGVVLREGHSVRAINYGCLDVKYLIPLMLEQRVKLKENGLLIASGIENEFVRVLAYIEYCGIKLDVGKWQAKMKKDRDLLNEKEAILNQWILDYGDAKYIKEDNDLFEGHTVKCNINWNSSKQLIPLFETLGFNLITKDKKTGQTKKTVDAQIIKKQSDKSTIVEPYLAYSSAFKTVSTYGQTFIDHINPVTKRLHTQYNQMVDTGRLSCGGKNKDTGEEYDNLQNLPSDAETRACFVASEGHKLIDCDYTAQEDLVFTQLCQEPKLIEFYNDKTRKRDGHSFVAKICFPKDLNDVPEEEVKHVRPDLRALAKKAKFSIHYGGNGSTIAKNLGLDLEVGNAIEKSYLSGFTNINNYFQLMKKQMWTRGYILISEYTGHKMFLPEWKRLKEMEKTFTQEFWTKYRLVKQAWIDSGKDIATKPDMLKEVSNFFMVKSGYERNSLNAPIQGTSAIITKVAGIFYFNHLIENDLLFKVLIVNDVHDEYLVEVPDELVEQEVKALQECMERAGSMICKDVKLKAVPEVSTVWVH